MNPMIRVENLSKNFLISAPGFKKKTVRAVSNVNLKIQRGETYGLVGESGSGKSTLGRCILRLIDFESGSVFFDGQDLSKLNKFELRKIRKRMQVIFQDPSGALNPRMNVEELLLEPMEVHQVELNRKARLEKAKKMLDDCGLPAGALTRFPTEFSGGQRQRICIARALLLSPEFLICDEPVSALDVSIQAQILTLLKDLQKEHHLTLLFIAHDLKMVEMFSDRIGVMNLGKLVEEAPSRLLFRDPRHPYTKVLRSSIPIAHPEEKKERIILKGEIPSPLNPPTGCGFHTRCPKAQARCAVDNPLTTEEGERKFLCWYPEKS